MSSQSEWFLACAFPFLAEHDLGRRLDLCTERCQKVATWKTAGFVQLFPILELPRTWSWASSTSSTSLFPLVTVRLSLLISHLRLLFLVAWSRRPAFVPISLYNISLSPYRRLSPHSGHSPSLLCILCVLFLSNCCIVQ